MGGEWPMVFWFSRGGLCTLEIRIDLAIIIIIIIITLLGDFFTPELADGLPLEFE